MGHTISSPALLASVCIRARGGLHSFNFGTDLLAFGDA